MQIDLKVRHQRILGVQQVPRLVIEKTRLFVYLNLDFDEEWNDCEIVVVLTNDYNAGHPVEIPADAVRTEDGFTWIDLPAMGAWGGLLLIGIGIEIFIKNIFL